MSISYGKEKPYLNSKHKSKVSEILDVVKSKKYGKPGTDVITLDSEGHRRIYLIDHSADKDLTDNLRDGDGFGIRKVYSVGKITKDDIREIIRNIASSHNFSEKDIYNVLSQVGITSEHLSGIDIAAELKMVPSSDDSMVLSTRGEGVLADNDRSGVDGRESQGSTRLEDKAGYDGIETFTTPQGEVYGFVDKDGNIYLDETKISPEHPIHEYTHVWDRVVAKRNPELWKKGVELMKQTSISTR